MDPDDNAGDDQTPKRRRGPYKRYLLDPSIPIPKSTLHSRQQAERIAARGEAAPHCQENPSHEQEDTMQEQPEDDIMEVEASNQTCEAGAPPAETPISSRDPAHTCEERTGADRGKKHKKSYVEKHNLSDQLHNSVPTTRLEALLMILHLAVRHCHTQHFIEDQINFVNGLFGGNVLDTSYHVFRTLFKPSIEICRHYFCVDCDLYLGTQNDLRKCVCPQCKKTINKCASESSDWIVCKDCELVLGARSEFPVNDEYTECTNCFENVPLLQRDLDSCTVCSDCKLLLGAHHLKKSTSTECAKCKKEIDVDSADSGNYFITLPVREQIQELLAKLNLKLVSRSDRDSNIIADICDGEIYKKLSQPGLPLSDPNSLTVTFNTDGVAMHKSTSNSLWPIQLYINEVVPEQRFK